MRRLRLPALAASAATLILLVACGGADGQPAPKHIHRYGRSDGDTSGRGTAKHGTRSN